MIDVDKAIASAVKTGKVVLGANEAVRSARTGKNTETFFMVTSSLDGS